MKSSKGLLKLLLCILLPLILLCSCVASCSTSKKDSDHKKETKTATKSKKSGPTTDFSQFELGDSIVPHNLYEGAGPRDSILLVYTSETSVDKIMEYARDRASGVKPTERLFIYFYNNKDKFPTSSNFTTNDPYGFDEQEEGRVYVYRRVGTSSECLLDGPMNKEIKMVDLSK